MTEEGTSKAEWEKIFMDLDAKIRKEVASVVGAEETDDWKTIGRKTDEKARAEAAKGVGAEPDEDWEQIGERLKGNIKSGIAKAADAAKHGDGLDQESQSGFFDRLKRAFGNR